MQVRWVGFWSRSVAFILDLFILNILYLVLALVGAWAVGIGLRAVHLESPSTDLVHFLIGLYLWVWFLLFLSYFIFFLACGGQTPAKMILKLRVMREDQQPVSWQRALLRTLGYLLSGPLLIGLGFVIIAFHPRKMALHDLIAGTMVVHDPS